MAFGICRGKTFLAKNVCKRLDLKCRLAKSSYSRLVVLHPSRRWTEVVTQDAMACIQHSYGIPNYIDYLKSSS